MKRLALVLALLLFAPLAAAQTTTVVTDTVRDLTGNVVPTGQVTFQLMPPASPTISGVGTFSSQTIVCTINQAAYGTNVGQIEQLSRGANEVTATFNTKQPFVVNDVITVNNWSDSTFDGTFTVDSVIPGQQPSIVWGQTGGDSSTTGGYISALRASPGPGSCTLTQNTALTPQGTYYSVTVWPQFSPTASFVFYALSNTVDLSSVVPTPTQLPTSGFALTNAANTWTAAQSFPAGTTWTGGNIFNGPLGTQTPTPASSIANQNGPCVSVGSNYWNSSLSTSQPDDWSFCDIVTDSSSSSFLSITHSGATSGPIWVALADAADNPVTVFVNGFIFANGFSDQGTASPVATTGAFRLTDIDAVTWRNSANTGDNALSQLTGTDSNNYLGWNGNFIPILAAPLVTGDCLQASAPYAISDAGAACGSGGGGLPTGWNFTPATDGFVATFAHTFTASRILTVPDASGTFALLSNPQSWSAAQTFNNVVALQGLTTFNVLASQNPTGSAGVIRLNGALDELCWLDSTSANDCLSATTTGGDPPLEWEGNVVTTAGSWINGDCYVMGVVIGQGAPGPCGSGGSSVWSALTAPSANLSLSMSTHTTTFIWPLFQWAWDENGNFTGSTPNAATSSANKVGPAFTLSGNIWTGTTSAEDAFQIAEVPGSGANPSSQLQFAHIGPTSGPISAVFEIPVTIMGALTLPTQTANYGFMAPNGSSGTPLWRALVDADLPAITLSKLTAPANNGDVITGVSGVWADAVPGVAGRAVTTGTTDTIANADRLDRVGYDDASNVNVTFTSPASLGNNFQVTIWNQGAGIPTLTPGAGTINGVSSLAIPEGSWCAPGSIDNVNLIALCSPGLLTAGTNITITPATGGFGEMISASGGGGAAFPQTVSGTTSSGGIPYFSSATQLSSSAPLPAGDFVLGGGAGGAPTATFSVIPNSDLPGSGATVPNGATCTLGSTCDIAQLFDTNGFAGVQLSTVASAVNAETVLESATGSAVEMIPGGSASDSSIEQLVSSKGGGEAALYAPGSGNAEAVSVSGDVILNAESSAHHVRSLSAFVHSSEVVTFSATPAFAAGQYDTFEMTLTGNVTSSTISSAMTGERISFTVCQNSTGGFTFAWPTGFRGAGTIGTAASTCSSQLFWYDGTSYFAISTMVTGE